MADNNFAYMDMPLQIGFQYAGPLDKFAQFATRADADTWLNGALSYEGALVRVKETLVDNAWHLYKVEIINETKTFTPASEIEVVNGKVRNTYLNTTVNCAEVGKLVETNADGLIDHALLGVTVNGTGEYGKVVITNKSGFVDPALLNLSYTTVGGEGTADKIVKVGSNGLLDSSLIPSIAMGEDLGLYADWTAAESGVAHTPEHGDTIAIGTADEKEIFVCVSPNAGTFKEKFVSLRPASGVVAISEFNKHKNNENDEKHVTVGQISAWDGKLDAEDVLSGTNISVVDNKNGTITINNTYTYTLSPATEEILGGIKAGNTVVVDSEGTLNVKKASTSQLGAVQVGGGINVNDGVISVNETLLQSHFDGRYYVLKDGETQADSMLTDNNLTDELKEKYDAVVDWYDGGKEIQDASTTQKGVVQIGNNIDVTNGVISVATATDKTLGLVKVGENINVANGVISVATATKDTLGLVKIGSGLIVEDGEVSANILWTKLEGLPALSGGTDGKNKSYTWEKVCEVKIFDENGGIVFPSEYIVKDGKTRIEFPADFPADNEDTAKWTVLVGPAIQ